MDRFNGHRFPVALAAFIIFFGCDQGSPTSPSAAKSTEVAVEQCPMPILDITGTWVNLRVSRDSDSEREIILADTLRIELAPDPNPTGEPGVTYYHYTLQSYMFERPRDLYTFFVGNERWDSEFGDFIALGLDPPLLSDYRGKMGVYSEGDGTWAFNYARTYGRWWNFRAEEYRSTSDYLLPGEEYESRPRWGNEVKMFDGWLVLWWVFEEVEYKRVDQ